MKQNLPQLSVPRSVLQDWVMQRPLRQQGVLILALRGMDGTRKESLSKPVLRSLRACVMNCGRTGLPMVLGEFFETDRFMRMDLISDAQKWLQTTVDFYSEIDSFNLHFYQHLMHAAAICGIGHPTHIVREHWWYFYVTGCNKLHMQHETIGQLNFRLRDGIRPESDE